MQQATSKLIAADLVQSAHDCSEGGLFINLLESAMVRNLGVDIKKSNTDLRNDAFLFGEAQSRIVISVKPNNAAQVETMLNSLNVSFEKLGTVTESNMVIDGANFGQTTDFAQVYNTSLEKALA